MLTEWANSSINRHWASQYLQRLSMRTLSSAKLHFVFSPEEVAAEGTFLIEAAMMALMVIITREIQSPARCQRIRQHILGWRRGRQKESAGTKYFQEYLNSSKFNSSFPPPIQGICCLGGVFCIALVFCV